MSAADVYKFTTIAHADRALLGPVSEATLDALLDTIAADLSGTEEITSVLDVGCGKGEMLVRAAQRFDATAVGVDPNPTFVAAARTRAAKVGIAARVKIHPATLAEADVRRASFDLAICAGATHAFGLFADALPGLRAYLRPGGRMIVGDGYWKKTPDPEYLEVFGGDGSDLTPLDDMLAAIGKQGLHVLACRESTLEDWDSYEGAYAAGVRAWLSDNAAHDDAPAFRERIERWNGAYRRYGRHTLGFVMIALHS